MEPQVHLGMAPYFPTKNFSDALEALAYFTECQIATFEWWNMKANPPKGELARQKFIMDEMIASCIQFGVSPEAARRASATRVHDILKEGK